MPALAEDGGIQLLLDLAKSGQVDPWNVDIAAVADRYLQAVEQLQATDLRVTGKTLLYLAILLRMKSEHLAGVVRLMDASSEDTGGLPDWVAGEEGPPQMLEEAESALQRLSATTVRSLEQMLTRRTSLKQPRTRPVTLEEIILELKKVEAQDAEEAVSQRLARAQNRREMMDYARLTADDIEQLAHEEFQEDRVDQVLCCLEVLWQTLPRVPLSMLCLAAELDRIQVFLSLLFLAARSHVVLHQEQFYEELWVLPPSDAAMAAEA